MPAALVSAICGALWLASLWMAYGHRQRMGSDRKDQPKDPHVRSQAQVHLAFTPVMLAQAQGLYRRIALEYGAWDTGPFAPHRLYRELMDFLPLPANDLTLLLGAGVFVGGFALRFQAIRILGKLFTFQIGIRAEHKIVEEGAYRVIRHPSYTGLLLMYAGIGLAYASLFQILGMLGGAAFFLHFRMNDEEKMLVQHFGEPYREYIRRTRRLIPFIY